MRPGHLGDRVAALVDGQLGHADRDRVLAHLARCADCRVEAAEQRALKARLDHLDVRAPGGLEQRLLALPTGYGGLPAGAGRRAPVPGPPVPPLAAAAVPSAPHRRPPAALGALLLVGLGAGVAGTALGGGVEPPRRDPGLPGLVVEHATATTHVPLPDPAVVGAAWSTSTAPGAGGGVPAVTPVAVTPVSGYPWPGGDWPGGDWPGGDWPGGAGPSRPSGAVVAVAPSARGR